MKGGIALPSQDLSSRIRRVQAVKIAYKPPYPSGGERAALGLPQYSSLDPDYILGRRHCKEWMLRPLRVEGSKCAESLAPQPAPFLLGSPQMEPFYPCAPE